MMMQVKYVLRAIYVDRLLWYCGDLEVRRVYCLPCPQGREGQRWWALSDPVCFIDIERKSKDQRT